MINLLPLENKKNIWRDYRNRRSVTIALVVMFLLLTGIILLTAFYFSSLFGLQPRASVVVEKNEKDRPAYELKLKNLKEELALLSGPSNNFSAISVFERISQTKVAGVGIESFSQEIKTTGEIIFKLQVTAGSRKMASDYISKLHSVEGVKDVVYPILTSDKNLTIPLEIILADKKK
ncbi:MAG: hypothetical protein WCW56_01145 [Candidatus Paceibacterota bacterium]|jgi:hypothetical protein